MQANNFDEALRRSYEAYDPPYDPASWKALAQKLPVPGAAGKFLIWPVALGLAASAAAACVLLFSPASTPQRSGTGNPARMTTSRSNQAAVTVPADTRQEAPAAAAVLASRRARRAAAPARPPFHSQTTIATRATAEGAAQIAAEKSPVTKEVAVLNDHHSAYTEPIIAIDNTERDTRQAKTVVSLAGGVQYGNLNAGYVAGIEVQHNIGGRWYVETGLGYLNYSSAGIQQIAATQYDAAGKAGANGLILGPSAATVQPRRIVQYLQAAPGVGFHVVKGISVAAGVDLQRALQNTDQDAIRVDGSDVKLLPLFDVGATGKLVFQLSRRLEAGILYRQGMNNFLRPGQSYLDRQYLQVQLKVPLLKR